MFWGECEFKTPMPDNVRSTGYTSFIKKHTAVLLTDTEVQQFVVTIQSGTIAVVTVAWTVTGVE